MTSSSSPLHITDLAEFAFRLGASALSARPPKEPAVSDETSPRPLATRDDGDTETQALPQQSVEVSPVLPYDRVQGGDTPRANDDADSSNDTPTADVWCDVVREISILWNRFRARHGWSIDLDPKTERALDTELMRAQANGDLHLLAREADRWGQAWRRRLREAERAAQRARRLDGRDIGRLAAKLSEKERSCEAELLLQATFAELHRRASRPDLVVPSTPPPPPPPPTPLSWNEKEEALIGWFQSASLPTEPFALDDARMVVDPAAFLDSLRRDIALGPAGPRARTGALISDLAGLRRRAAQDNTPEKCTSTDSPQPSK